MVGGKTPNIVIQLVWQNKLHVFFPVLLYLKTNLFGRRWRGETRPPPKFYPVIHEYSRNFPPKLLQDNFEHRWYSITLKHRFSIHSASRTFLLPVLFTL